MVSASWSVLHARIAWRPISTLTCKVLGWRRSCSKAPMSVSSLMSRTKMMSMGEAAPVLVPDEFLSARTDGRTTLSVILDVLEALVIVRRTFQRATFLARLPLNHFLDFSGKREVLVGDAFGGMRDELHDHERVRDREVGMVPRRLRKLAHRVHHHKRALPAAGLELSSDPAVLVIPVRQFSCQALLHLVLAVGLLGWFRHLILLRPRTFSQIRYVFRSGSFYPPIAPMLVCSVSHRTRLTSASCVPVARAFHY